MGRQSLNKPLNRAFIAIVKAGLWEQSVRLTDYMGNSESLNISELTRLANEQSLTGIVAIGLEHVQDVRMAIEDMLPIMEASLSIQAANTGMDVFISKLFEDLRNAGISAVLVKGQGIAQCYERPLWRACGDVDLLLIGDDYPKAQKLMGLKGIEAEKETISNKHHGFKLENYLVELHGTLHSVLSPKIDGELDNEAERMFRNREFRFWKNGESFIPLPSVNHDVVFIFSHILQHFHKEGIGLRQICDWCRLLWTYREEIDTKYVEGRIKKMGLMSEWKAFAALAVDSLGMPSKAMPFYDNSKKWSRKASKILDFIFFCGNFGQNIDSSYYHKHSYLVRKAISFKLRVSNFLRRVGIFPLDSLAFFFYSLVGSFKAVARGK